MKKILRFIAIFCLIALLALELILRINFGFCQSVLMLENPDYEYIAQPSQIRQRFGNRIVYNNYSMRSDLLNPSSLKILGFGDSVINGGSLTDQDSLATKILSDSLSKLINKPVQFLNISAGSWGPDNCFSYLKTHGNFGAKCIFLIVSSHDAYDNMNFEKIVGINKNFPNRQYSLAVCELFDRYILEKIRSKKNNTYINELGINKKKSHSTFNEGFISFLNYSTLENLSLIVLLHAEKNEVVSNKYNSQGQEIIKFCNENNITLLKDLDYSMNIDLYRDNIHLNDKGQKKLFGIIMPYLRANKDLLLKN